MNGLWQVVALVIALVIFLLGVLQVADMVRERDYHELVDDWRDVALAWGMVLAPVVVWAAVLLHAARVIG